MLGSAHRSLRRSAAVGAIALGAMGLAACGGDDTAGSEEGVSVEELDVQDRDVPEAWEGVYDQEFYQGVQDHIGDTVTLSARVTRVLGETAFTIGGENDTEATELLVTHEPGTVEVSQGEAVSVTGIVERAYAGPTLDDPGVESPDDLTDASYEGFQGQPYVAAVSVDPTMSSQGTASTDG